MVAASLVRALDAAVLGSDISRALGVHPVRVWGLAALAVITFLAGFIPITLIGLFYAGRLGLSLRQVAETEAVVEERVEEETGRRELLGATVVGRHASLAAAVVVTAVVADSLRGQLDLTDPSLAPMPGVGIVVGIGAGVVAGLAAGTGAGNRQRGRGVGVGPDHAARRALGHRTTRRERSAHALLRGGERARSLRP